MAHASYQRRLKEIAEYKKRAFIAETAQETLAYDNKMMQSEYNAMQHIVDSCQKSRRNAQYAAAFWMVLFIIVSAWSFFL